MDAKPQTAGAALCSAAGRAEILRGVGAAWAPLLFGLDAALAAVDALGDGGRTAPGPGLILEPLRYGTPADVEDVIIAQDPYPTEGHAQGLCFSVPAGTPVPDSLQRIFGCLDRAGLRPRYAGAKGKDAACGDLRPWAAQGVLMINAAWTTRAGVRRAHAKAWKAFTEGFLAGLCAARAGGRPLRFFLWGGDAQAFAPLARRHGHAVFEWGHPSPLGDNPRPEPARFRMCPHFEECNALRAAAGRRPVVWDNRASAIAFTDGSCANNGQPGARAAFATIFAGGTFGQAGVCGEVRPAAYALVDEDAPERGVRADPAAPGHVAPTNNRAELLGVIYALLGLLRGRALGLVEVVSDSKITVQTLNLWLPARLKKGTERALMNFDLVWAAWRILGALRAQARGVALVHTHAHGAAPPAAAPARERLYWLGNDTADRLAATPLVGRPTYGLTALGASPALQAIVDAANA